MRFFSSGRSQKNRTTVLESFVYIPAVYRDIQANFTNILHVSGYHDYRRTGTTPVQKSAAGSGIRAGSTATGQTESSGERVRPYPLHDSEILGAFSGGDGRSGGSGALSEPIKYLLISITTKSFFLSPDNAPEPACGIRGIIL